MCVCVCVCVCVCAVIAMHSNNRQCNTKEYSINLHFFFYLEFTSFNTRMSTCHTLVTNLSGGLLDFYIARNTGLALGGGGNKTITGMHTITIMILLF